MHLAGEVLQVSIDADGDGNITAIFRACSVG